MKSLRITMIALLFLIICQVTSSIFGDDDKLGERAILLGSGESGSISYGAYQLVSNDKQILSSSDCDLLLIIRNTGAKHVDLNGVTASDFSLKDSDGKDVKFVVRVPPANMAFGSVTVAHLLILKDQSNPPWTLQFKSRPNAIVPFRVTVRGLKPVIREDKD